MLVWLVGVEWRCERALVLVEIRAGHNLFCFVLRFESTQWNTGGVSIPGVSLGSTSELHISRLMLPSLSMSSGYDGLVRLLLPPPPLQPDDFDPFPSPFNLEHLCSARR